MSDRQKASFDGADMVGSVPYKASTSLRILIIMMLNSFIIFIIIISDYYLINFDNNLNHNYSIYGFCIVTI
jgi:hypothetical protein